MPQPMQYFGRHLGSHGGVLHQFSLAAGASHAQVLDRAAETGQLVAFEVGHGHDRIGLDDLGADVGLLQQFSVNGDLGLGDTAQAVADDQRRADTGIAEAVLDARRSGPRPPPCAGRDRVWRNRSETAAPPVS